MEKENLATELRKKIVAAITADFKNRFRVIDNKKSSPRAINGTFPDIILMRQIPPENDNILFIMKIEEDTSSDLLDAAPIWKLMSESFGYLYVVVDSTREQEARKIISTVGIRAKLAVFEKDVNGKISIKYD